MLWCSQLSTGIPFNTFTARSILDRRMQIVFVIPFPSTKAHYSCAISGLILFSSRMMNIIKIILVI